MIWVIYMKNLWIFVFFIYVGIEGKCIRLIMFVCLLMIMIKDCVNLVWIVVIKI